MQETCVQSLGREDILEKEMATHSSILAWKIPWIEELGGLQAQGVAKSHTWLHFHFHFIFTRISKQAKLFWKQKKISDCTLDWAMTVMKHAVSVTQSVCVCENFVKKTFKICASVSVLCINRKKKAMRKILNSGYICILKHLKYQKCTDWYLKFTLNCIKN